MFYFLSFFFDLLMKSRRSWSAKVIPWITKGRWGFFKADEIIRYKKLGCYSKTVSILAWIQKEIRKTMSVKVKKLLCRWYNHLVPGISKRIWSKNEEEKLLALHNIHGNKWTVIAEHMPGRLLSWDLELIIASKITFILQFDAVWEGWESWLAPKTVLPFWELLNHRL